MATYRFTVRNLEDLDDPDPQKDYECEYDLPDHEERYAWQVCRVEAHMAQEPRWCGSGVELVWSETAAVRPGSTRGTRPTPNRSPAPQPRSRCGGTATARP